MAEGLLTAVVRKLTEFAVEKVVGEVQSKIGIREEVGKLSRQLKFIQAFIEDADKKHIVDKRQMEWVKNVMDIAYQIEDAIDIFHLKWPKELPDTVMGRLGWLAKRTTRISFLYEFQKELKAIHDRIREIEEYRQEFAINTLGQDFGGQNTSHTDQKPKLDPIGDPEIVGFVADLDNIVNRLCDKENQSLAVVSIVGPGGIGKTTLARKACNSNEVVKSFGNPLWITISQEYKLIHVLENIASKLKIVPDRRDVNTIASQIRESLEQRRYLIVLDDVWTEEVWAEIVEVLPNKKNGSRVLFTTRIEKVAKGADTTYEPYQLPLLDEEQSLELFLKNAVPKMYRCSIGTIATNLKGLAKEFATKCKGLPLALEVLGSLLSKTKYDYHAWNNVLQTLSWQDEGCERINTIAASYEHLPLAKKLCFMYFAAFPEDKKIDAKSLHRIWVAERLIPDGYNRTLEETAECFLEDLVQRSLVQVSERFPDGSIKSCRVHDVLRDLAIHKAKEMNFLMVCSKVDDWRSCSKARRVAIHYSDVNDSMDNYASPNVRSLLIFGGRSKPTDFSKYRVLKVLGSMHGKVKLERYTGLPHLKYLQLDTFLKYEENKHEFGEWIRSLKYLETLDLRGSDHEDISHWIWHIKTLRHVLLYSDFLPPSLEYEKTRGPPASLDVKNLQTLRAVRYNESWETLGVPNISDVRELDIRCCVESSVATLTSLLCKLKHVVCLKMMGDCGDFLKVGMRDFPFYKNLKSLVLIKYYFMGGVPFTLSDDMLDMLPPHLTELRLRGFQFASDPMPVLDKLRSLNTLHLSARGMHMSSTKIRIKCSAGMFEQLQELMLEQLIVDEWEIEMGAMPMLKRLCIQDCDQLSVPPALIHLDRLQNLYWVTDNQANKDAIDNIFEQRPLLRSSLDMSWHIYGDYI